MLRNLLSSSCEIEKAVVRLFTAVLLAVVVAVSSTDLAAAERVALVIGNGEYRNAPNLRNPSQDAEAITAKLQGLKFQVTTAVNADLASMRLVLKNFSTKAHGADIAVVFYAGHGLQVDGENYLLPVDAGLQSRSDLMKSSLAASEVFKSLVDAQPNAAVLILDACRDNPFAKMVSTAPGLASGSVSAGALAQRPNSAGMLIGFAAAPGAVAFDGGNGNSPFTTALLQWIDRPGLEIGTMLRRVRSTVVELTRGAQVPWVEESLLKEVYLYPAETGTSANGAVGEGVDVALLDKLRALSLPEERVAGSEFYKRLTGNIEKAKLILASSGGAPSHEDEEFVSQGLVWLSIRGSSDPEIFQKYLDVYPSSPFADVARERLASVQTSLQSRTDKLLPQETKAGILIVGIMGEEDYAQPDLPGSPAIGQGNALSSTVESEDGQQIGGLIIEDMSAGDAVAPDVVAPTPGLATEPVDHPSKAEPQVEPLQPPAAETNDEPSSPPEVQAALPTENDEKPAQTPPAAKVDDPDVAAAVQTALDRANEVSLGLGSNAVSGVQALLATAGKYKGEIDGSLGAGTRAAIAAFQKSESLSVDGHLNQHTLQRLVGRYGPKALKGEFDLSKRDAIHVIAAVAARGPDAKPVVLRVAAIDRNDSVHAFWSDLAFDFEFAHPGYRVEISHQPDYEYKATLLGMLGSATPPDIMHTWGGGHLDALREAGFARDLSEEMSNGWAMEFRPGPLQSYVRDGRIFGVPASVELVSLWANKALLAKAGVTSTQLTNWDGVLEAARKLKANGIVPIAVGGRDRWPFQLIWGSMAEQIGGRDVFDSIYAGTGDAFLAPAFIEAGKRLRQLADLGAFQPDFMNESEGDAGMLFSKGQAAMVITGNWRLNTMRWNWPGGFDQMKQELVRLDIPGSSGSGEGPLTYGGVDGYVVNKKAPAMAVEFLRLLTSPAAQSRIAELADSVPSVSGADLSIADPFVGGVADALLRSRYHQLYIDQALGPVTGEVVNDVATRLATGKMQGEDAAREINLAWEQSLVGAPTRP